MDCYLLEDWNTLKGGGAGTSVIQSEPSWVDLRAYREMVVWLDLREFSSSTNITVSLQTAPAKEESLFTTMAAFGGATNPLVSGVSTKLIAPETVASPLFPLARWVRWSVAFAAAGDLTFRIWIAANQPGRRANAGNGAAMRR